MWPFPKHRTPVEVSKDALKRMLFVNFDGYVAYLLDSMYTLVPDQDWVLSHCPRSKPWSKEWDCNKITIAAMGKMQTHAIGAVVVSWPDNETTHALLLVAYESGLMELFDPHSGEFHSVVGKKIFKLWL